MRRTRDRSRPVMGGIVSATPTRSDRPPVIKIAGKPDWRLDYRGFCLLPWFGDGRLSIAVLRRNSRCVSKPAILLGYAITGVPEKSKSSLISKGLRLTRGRFVRGKIQSLW
jgi:hypothetical protein